jgi:hypothetical protein
VDVATAAAAAVAATGAAGIGAQPLLGEQRALEGFRLAQGVVGPGASPQAVARADTFANARTAMYRADLPLATSSELRTVLGRLGEDIASGRLNPNLTNKFQAQLYDLATGTPGSSAFEGALAQMRAAAQTLDQVTLKPGTAMAYDPTHGTDVSRAGLPTLQGAQIDADLYYQTADGRLHVDSAKASIPALAEEAKRSVGNPQSQIARQTAWREAAADAGERGVGFNARTATSGFDALLDDRNLAQIKTAAGHPSERNIVLGERAYSPNDLSRINEAGTKALQAHVEAARAQHAASGAETPFKPDYRSFLKDNLASPELARERLGIQGGKPLPELRPVVAGDLPTARQGGLIGGVTALGIGTVAAAWDGKVTGEEARQIGAHTALGVGTGAVMAAGERVVTPLVDRVAGRVIQNGAQRLAGQFTASAVGAGTAGTAVRAVATRALGSSVVGAAVVTGLSAYENRAGLARGDAQAIGNVTADATVAAGSIAASMAVGAAVGSVVPVAGTAVGAVVGLAVGVGVAYGAQISGVRDGIANGVSSVVNGIKSWF